MQSMLHRRSIRMKGVDYSLEGAYFVTLVTYQRACIFGEIINGSNSLNPYGRIASEQWQRLKKRFRQNDFSIFTIMPNHIHGVICIVRGAGEKLEKNHVRDHPLRPSIIPNVIPGSLGAIVRAYKAAVTYRINALRGYSCPPVWQRNYYDHIIRNQKDYEANWDYIETNPLNWREDRFKPDPTSE